MAKAKKPPEPPKPELTEEQKREVFLRTVEESEAADLKIKVITKDLKAAKGTKAALRKQAKKDGINLDALDTAMALKKRDPKEVIAAHNVMVGYLRWLDAPMGKQFSLFDDEVVRNVVTAIDDGRRAGKEESPRENNPYQPGTAEFAQWDEGWQETFMAAQTKIVNEMRPEGTPPVESPVQANGRGRKRRAHPAAIPPVPTTETPAAAAASSDDWERVPERVKPDDGDEADHTTPAMQASGNADGLDIPAALDRRSERRLDA